MSNLDKAINKCRDLAYGECEPNPYYGMPYFKSEEYEQLAEWLEELKERRRMMKVYGHCGYLEADIKNKAIDDFAEKVKEIYPFTILELEELDDIVEQLKEGGSNS